MADNTTLPATGTGTADIIVATDKIAGVDYQRVKVTWGVDGTATDAAATAANAFPINIISGIPTGTNVIGGITVPTDPFGANADAASATGSISAKLRYIASTGIPVTYTARSLKMAYAASSAVTITLASLATDASLLTGRESTEIDNSSNLYLDYLVAGTIMTGTSPTTGKEIRVYAVGQMNDSTYPDVFDGTDSGETVSGVGTRDSVCRLIAVIPTVATSNLAYYFGPVSVAAVFGGVCPRKFVFFVTHNTAVNLHATGGNHVISITPVYRTL